MYRRSENGSALLAAIMLVAVLGIGAMTLYKHLNYNFDDYARFERELKLVHLADAGIDTAIASLREGHDSDTLEITLGEGLIHVRIVQEENANIWHITSEATLSHEGIARAKETYSARVSIIPEGAVQRLSWKREKKQ